MNRLKKLLQIPTKYRISVGLVGIVITAVMASVFVGILPDKRRAVIEGRTALSESIAINLSLIHI